jgi:hypothetical protein
VRRQECGFAMLFVLLMAGMIAITLYMALPRAAFEAQREKEQTLIDRGSQYKRAIQLYVRQNKRWPAKVEDLEDTNGKRYLRRRYVDPMTGKDEWRPVHVGPNGVLTDSLIKPKEKAKEGDTFNNVITDLGGVNALPDGTQTAGNPGLRKRQSDQQNPGTGTGDGSLPGQPGQPGQTTVAGGAPLPGNTNGQPGQGFQPPNSGQQIGAGGLPQQLQGGNVNSGQQPATGSTGGISVLAGIGGGYSTAPGANGQTPPPTGGLQNTLQGQNTGGQGQPGANGNTPANAAQLIQGLLTSPRPGGPPGTPTGSGVGQVQGGGIAGFASKFEGDSIKVYNDQTEYQKWEFVYDMSKDTMVTGAQQAIPQAPGPNSTTGFGNTSTTSTGTGSGMGTATTATPTGTTPPTSTVGH